MPDLRSDKLVLFGAGKIGRSFIGQLFSRGGYEVVFIDIDKQIIEELNRRRSYQVFIKSEKEEVLTIENVRGIKVSEEQGVINEIATARIVAVSVGTQGISSVVPLIAKGLIKRYDIARGTPLDIIIAENMRNGASYMRAKLIENLPDWYPINELVGLVETSIGKMVPIMPKKEIEKDILKVYAEPYNTLILDKLAFKNPIPKIEGLAPKDHIKAWVDRKLFIHNLGHVSAAYSGFYYYPDETYMYEVLGHEEIRRFTREAMLQSSKILNALYPYVFTEKQLLDHIDDLIARFRNKALGDTVFRVGRDLLRKLGYNDRLLSPFHAGVKLNMPVDKIAKAVFYGTQFRAKDENGQYFKRDLDFFKMVREKGVMQVLKTLCKLDEMEYEIISKQFSEH